MMCVRREVRRYDVCEREEIWCVKEERERGDMVCVRERERGDMVCERERRYGMCERERGDMVCAWQGGRAALRTCEATAS